LTVSVIVLAGGSSRRLGKNKALVELAGRPLVLHVLERVEGLSNDIIVVVSSREQKSVLKGILSEHVRLIVDEERGKCPLVGALTGFKAAENRYSLLLSCDTPFLSRAILLFLIDLSVGVDAVVPRWPNEYVEPLQAVYKTKSAYLASLRALRDNRRDMRSMINFLGRVRYVSTLVLEKIDPGLATFLNVNTEEDLKVAELLLDRKVLDGSDRYVWFR